jgi:uncharacterized membrane protein YbhN (UPF0104 family)
MFRAHIACARDIVTLKSGPRNPGQQILIKSMGMSSVSTGRKLGIAARVAGRVISQHARRTRTFGAVTKAARATASHFGRVLGQLWLEVTGFVFLFLAGIGVIAFFREYAKYQAGHTTSGRVMLAVCFAALFGWFGVDSFWRVRKRGQNH